MVRKASRQDNAQMTRRLLRSMPASKFEMQTLTRLAGIVVTPDVPTASVECKRRPRLLINPRFVAENCPRDEHLFLLIMHELWHVLLAHTRMYPISTRAHNIAFDAVINAGLMAKFSAPEYRGFFDKLYKPDEFPYCLLRPPEGWPLEPKYPDVGPPGTRGIIERLYPIYNYRPAHQQRPLYEEILKLLLDSGMNLESVPLLLLGDHNTPATHPDGSPVNDPFMKKALEELSGKWSPIMMDGRGYGRGMNHWEVEIAPSYDNARRVFSNILKRAVGKSEGKLVRREKSPIEVQGSNGVILNPRDRLQHARRLLGDRSLLYTQKSVIRSRNPERPATTYVYLDVSGSMARMLPHMLTLLIPYAVRGQLFVYQFSTKVTPLTVADLSAGKLTTTGGTDINCVLEHITNSKAPVRKAILLTDGGVGTPLAHLAHQITESGIALHAVLPNRCRMNNTSEPLMRSTIELPPAG